MQGTWPFVSDWRGGMPEPCDISGLGVIQRVSQLEVRTLSPLTAKEVPRNLSR